MPRVPNRVGLSRVPQDDVLFKSYLSAYADSDAKSAAFDSHFPKLAFSKGSGREADDYATDEAMHRVFEAVTSLRSETSCLICLEGIQRDQPIWHCEGGCFCVLHLACIQAWARQQLQEDQRRRLATRLSGVGPPLSERELLALSRWECPKCRKQRSEVPSTYLCFCGKEKDPALDPWADTPHSCSSLCQRPLGCTEEGHTCLLICHPGPCPPCPRLTEVSCGCGRQTVTVRCNARQEGLSCGEVCGRRHAKCGHPCPEVCHGGECPPCALEAVATCHCGGLRRLTPCHLLPLSCERPCSQPLPCGKHTCTRICHSPQEPHEGCPGSLPRPCPCGKTTLTPFSCDQPPSTCPNTCERILACGLHRCHDKCHLGECGTCRAPVVKTCACGDTRREVQCSQEVKCEKRCTAMKGCGLHKCNQRCCQGNHPPCNEVCGKKLKCGNHKCPAPCGHVGPCLPCPVALEVPCACGATAYQIPCGTEKRTIVPPKCKSLCCIPTLCRHEAHIIQFPPPLPPLSVPVEELKKVEHQCHYGACRKCPNPCATLLPCGHVCPSDTCHDGLHPEIRPVIAGPTPPRVPNQGQFPPVQGAPKSRRAAALEEREGERDPPVMDAFKGLSSRFPGGHLYPLLTPCPPCVHPTTQRCEGGHRDRTVPCFQAAAEPSWSCENECGLVLPCSRHVCGKRCHDPKVSCGDCRVPCDLPRPKHCTHRCAVGRCHPGECVTCRTTVKFYCPCRKTAKEVPCFEYQGLVGEAEATGETPAGMMCTKVCSKQLPGCPHLCPRICHGGPCLAPDQPCRQDTTVRCPCKLRREKWPCSQVRAALLERGLRDQYDSAPRLLACDAGCEAEAAARKKARLAEEEEENRVEEERAMPATQRETPAAAAAASPWTPGRREDSGLQATGSSSKAPPPSQGVKRKAGGGRGQGGGGGGASAAKASSALSGVLVRMQDKFVELGRMPWQAATDAELAEAKLIRTAKVPSTTFIVSPVTREKVGVNKRVVAERQTAYQNRWRTLGLLYAAFTVLFVALAIPRVLKKLGIRAGGEPWKQQLEKGGVRIGLD